MFNLRPHHLLCFLGFRGLGYNDAFTQNFANIRENILSKPGLTLTLESLPDAICQQCPELTEGFCKNEEMVVLKDNFLLNFLEDRKITVELAYQKLKALEESKFITLCQDCRWYPLGFCLEGFRKLKSTPLFP
ncbi:DUF1284 domain-containing protein [Carboxydothermus pertinax]|uniref:DUF1284 domain-containing protein n=1 Tax=Carboxydothermus pertinax TaxID=870242 RepID=A0A1L8CXA6_9THEO|nr:DUF1284 domain-containing protein [Carboxydothermus pertinax]GAV23566.1 hypothetical protein cpu_20760 [Carboxydothermus pertinax]